MKITSVHIQLAPRFEGQLRAFARVTFNNSFVVRDIRIVEGDSGLFVAMPSRRLTAPCIYCGYKNHLKANYCNHCGRSEPVPNRHTEDSRQALFADIAHPISKRCRSDLEAEILKAYRRVKEQRQSRQGSHGKSEPKHLAGALLL